MSASIQVRNLSKVYRLGEQKQRAYQTLRESLVHTAGVMGRRLWSLARSGDCRPDADRLSRDQASFWALKDVSFDVKPGEVIGIIGRNGAGKSTLLKILSRITEPSAGRCELRGRMGSLLEVGTGFHPELTGRENIYMNGSILGMSRREIHRRFDEIVAFAEIEEFLDTPVKRYSSGMYVRLAFAVAAHLDPEILIVDEVLAVGDVNFQRKCLGRIRAVSREGGRTVLLVSHNMAAIESLCDRAITLDRGKLVAAGAVDDAIKHYHAKMHTESARGYVDLTGISRITRGDRFFDHVAVLDEAKRPTEVIQLGTTLRLRIGFKCPQAVDYPSIGVGIDDSIGQRILSIHTPLSSKSIGRLQECCAVDCVISQLPLSPGDYKVKLALSANGTVLDEIEQCIGFYVANADAFNEGRGFHRGVCVAASHWSLV